MTAKTKNAPTHALILVGFAPLQIVPTANYLRYGGAGVRRFSPGASGEPNLPAKAIRIGLTLKNVAGDTLWTQTEINFELASEIDLSGTNIWNTTVAEHHLTAQWVWDFYRLFSGIKLIVPIPPARAKAPTEWRVLHDTLRDIKAGDKIIAEGPTSVGDILQVYTLDKSAQRIGIDAATL